MCFIPGEIVPLRWPRDATADAPRAAPAITSLLASTQGLHFRKHRENQRDHHEYHFCPLLCDSEQNQKTKKNQKPKGLGEKWKNEKGVRRYLSSILTSSMSVSLCTCKRFRNVAASTISRIAASHTIPKAQGLWLWLSDCCLLNVFLETLLKRYMPGTVSNSEQQ